MQAYPPYYSSSSSLSASSEEYGSYNFSPETLLLQASTHLTKGEFKQAHEIYSNLSQSNFPNTFRAEAYYQLGWIAKNGCHGNQDTQQAILLLNEAIACDELAKGAVTDYDCEVSAKIYHCLGEIYFETGEYNKAYNHYELSADFTKTNEKPGKLTGIRNIWLSLADTYLREKNYTAAESLYKTLAENDQAMAEKIIVRLLKIGKAYASKDNTRQNNLNAITFLTMAHSVASTAYQHLALDKNRNSIKKAAYILGDCFLRQKDTDNAQKWYEIASAEESLAGDMASFALAKIHMSTGLFKFEPTELILNYALKAFESKVPALKMAVAKAFIQWYENDRFPFAKTIDRTIVAEFRKATVDPAAASKQVHTFNTTDFYDEL